MCFCFIFILNKNNNSILNLVLLFSNLFYYDDLKFSLFLKYIYIFKSFFVQKQMSCFAFYPLKIVFVVHFLKYQTYHHTLDKSLFALALNSLKQEFRSLPET